MLNKGGIQKLREKFSYLMAKPPKKLKPTDQVETHPETFDKIHKEYCFPKNFKDPFPYKPNFNVKTDKSAYDLDWSTHQNLYVNPPYSSTYQLKASIKAAISFLEGANVCLLIMSRAWHGFLEQFP